MFQPQPTPFASSFHAAVPHPHSQTGQNQALPPRSQRQSLQSFSGYGMEMEGNVAGGVMGGTRRASQMSDYDTYPQAPMNIGMGLSPIGQVQQQHHHQGHNSSISSISSSTNILAHGVSASGGGGGGEGGTGRTGLGLGMNSGSGMGLQGMGDMGAAVGSMGMGLGVSMNTMSMNSMARGRRGRGEGEGEGMSPLSLSQSLSPLGSPSHLQQSLSQSQAQSHLHSQSQSHAHTHSYAHSQSRSQSLSFPGGEAAVGAGQGSLSASQAAGAGAGASAGAAAGGADAGPSTSAGASAALHAVTSATAAAARTQAPSVPATGSTSRSGSIALAGPGQVPSPGNTAATAHHPGLNGLHASSGAAFHHNNHHHHQQLSGRNHSRSGPSSHSQALVHAQAQAQAQGRPHQQHHLQQRQLQLQHQQHHQLRHQHQLQHQHQHRPTQLQLQLQLQQLPLTGASPASVSASASAPAPAPASNSSSFYNANSSTNTNASPAASTSTRPSTMEPGDPSDLAAQEAAARDYQPQLEGPLVGNKITSDAITDEYAKADDIYVAKTINLPQTYSHYRPIQGDGNCGWRAIGFSYFEHLVNNGDQSQIHGEIARITSLNQYLLTVGGYDQMLFEDMVEETITLLKDLAQRIANPQLAMHHLVSQFNDQDISNAIIYHLRLLASSWLKGNAELYAPFIPAETGIPGYCAEIERPNREIENLGIVLLVQILLKPINFVLEIAYLDRSPGSQVNIYRFPDEANGQDPSNLGPIIYLLYRPDHYDILYKSPPTPAPLNLQVNRATSFSHRQEITSVTPSLHSFSSIDYSPLAMLPGFGGPSSGLSSALSSLGSPSSASPMADAYDPSPHSPWLATPYSDHLQQQQQQQPQQQPASISRPQPQPTPQPQQSTPAPAKSSQPVDYQLRFSHQCWHLSNTSSAQPSLLGSQSNFQEPSFTTAMFKNSHFNKAHYQNPHFHPEEWTPDDEGHERAAPTKKKSRFKPEY